MKKSVIALLMIFAFAITVNDVSAKVKATSPATASAIKLYKAGNYTQSYVAFSDIVKKDPSNSLAYYYLGMSSVQLGKRDEAENCYNKVITLSPNSVLGNYAKRGIKCLDDAVACHSTAASVSEDEQPEDRFIKSPFGSGLSNQARGFFEKQKIENMKREINRKDDIAPQKFRDYKDFSSQAEPTDEEIVAAIRTLNRAGLGNSAYNSDLSYIRSLQNNQVNDDYNMMNILLNNGGTSNLNPQVIQSLLTNQMTANF